MNHKRNLTIKILNKSNILLLLIFFCGINYQLFGMKLDSAEWKLTGPNAEKMKLMTDNDIHTVWDSGTPQTPGVSVVIDLGQSVYVYRIFLTCGNEVSRMARSLNCYVGDSLDSLKMVDSNFSLKGGDKYGGQTKYNRESNFIFNPTRGRYVKIELGNNKAGLTWAVAEISIHGATQMLPEANWPEVVMDRIPALPKQKQSTKGKKQLANQKQPAWVKTLTTASRDLQYYLMELLNQPVKRTTPDSLSSTSTLRFRLITPPEEKIPSPEPFRSDLDNISVRKVDKEILFGGLTARAVAYSVYQFLDSQGVRWLYPHTYGDYVPTIKTLDLSVLPLNDQPSFPVRFSLQGQKRKGGPFYPRTEHAWLFYLRNGINSFQRADPLMGVLPTKNIKGHFHTMGEIFPPEVEKKHPEWWPGPYRMKKGANAKEGGSGLNPCCSSPEVRDYIIEWIEKDYQSRIKKGLPLFQGYSIMPLDSAVFCECKRCVEKFGEAEKIDSKGSDAYHNLNYSEHFFYLINEVGLELKRRHPELTLWTCAYAQYRQPPKMIKKLSDNVMVDLCMQSPEYDLPLSFSVNSETRKIIEGWSKCCRHLGFTEYGLIQQDTTFHVPVRNIRTFTPFITAISDWHRQEKRMGIESLGTFVMGEQRHIPWAMYTWCRSAWNVNESAEKIADDFFAGYYGEKVGAEVKNIYDMVEKRMLDSKISMKDRWHNIYVPDPKIFTAELMKNANNALKKARSFTNTWYHKERLEMVAGDLEWSYRIANQKFGKITYPCHFLETPPKIDGKLDDSVWKNLPLQKGFLANSSDTAYKQQGPWALKRPTQFRIGWDKDSVYIAVECIEPEMSNIEKTGSERITVLWAHDGPKWDGRTVWFDLAGKCKTPHVIGPEEYKIGKQKDRWVLEAKFSNKKLRSRNPKIFPDKEKDYNLPGPGVRWAFNLVRWVTQTSKEDIWKKFTWSYTYHAGNYSYVPWFNHIEFFSNQLSTEEATALENRINLSFDKFFKRFTDHQAAVKIFDKKFNDCPDLFLKTSKGNRIWSTRIPVLWYKSSCEPVRAEVRSKNPITINGLKITWNCRAQIREWYSIEWWDGSKYVLLDKTRDNAFHIGIHEFEPITTDRLRVTIYGDRDGNMEGIVSTLISEIEAYYRANDDTKTEAVLN